MPFFPPENRIINNYCGCIGVKLSILTNIFDASSGAHLWDPVIIKRSEEVWIDYNYTDN